MRMREAGGRKKRIRMKRSEINTMMRSADQFIRSRGFYLPPFAYWSPNEWQRKGPEVEEIVSKPTLFIYYTL